MAWSDAARAAAKASRGGGGKGKSKGGLKTSYKSAFTGGRVKVGSAQHKAELKATSPYGGAKTYGGAGSSPKVGRGFPLKAGRAEVAARNAPMRTDGKSQVIGSKGFSLKRTAGFKTSFSSKGELTSVSFPKGYFKRD